MDPFTDIGAFPIGTSGSVFRDQWTASMVRCAMLPAQSPESKFSECALCKKKWPMELLWHSASCGNCESLRCAPCHRRLQRQPVRNSQPLSLTVLIRGSVNAAQVFSMNQVCNHVFNQEGMVVEESVLTLGNGKCAVRLRLKDDQTLYQVLRSAVPNCNIDYLPVAPDNSLYCVEVVSASSKHRLPSNADLERWLINLGGCSVVRVSSVTRFRALVQLADSISWEAALALNGEIVPCSNMEPIVAVMPATLEPHHNLETTTTDSTFSDSRPSGRMEILVLRALRDLPKAARRVVTSFLPMQLLVPADCTLQEALEQRPALIFLSSGSHHLPNGIRITSPVEVIGDADATEILLGGPVTICSAHGARMRNITFRVDPAANRPLASLLRVDASHLEAICWISHKSSQTSAFPSEACWAREPFAVCRGDESTVRLERCHFVGGRHAIDARGSIGLHRSHWRRGRNGFDVSAWLLRCRADWSTTDISDEVPVQFAMDAEKASRGSWPQWASRRCTRVHLHHCHIEGASEEALHAWRGADVTMSDCWVHHCGLGVSIAHSRGCNVDQTMQLLKQRPSRIVLERNIFEDLSTHSWSAAAALGCLVLCGGADESAQKLVAYREALETTECAQSKSFHPIDVILRRNKVTRCSMGFQACQVTLAAEENEFNELHLGAFHFRDSNSTLAKNRIDHVTGTAISISAETQRQCSGLLQKNTIRFCTLGVRVTSKVPLKVDSCDDKLENNKDAIDIQGVGCNVAIKRCTMQGSQRCGLHIDRKAHVILDGSKVIGNGRGVAVCDGSVDMQRCHFERNIGWAVRLEGPPGQYAIQDIGTPREAELTRGRPGEPLQLTNGSRSASAVRPSVITQNTFGAVSRGNVGRKRVRVDIWHNDSAEVEDNVGVNGEGPVEPLRKRRREDVAMEEETSLQLANLSLSS
eukprot:gnl/MRDRNA2_/MRDRNA2_91891_c0_seq1.p1 gnl/MRDRNA2_/MRDRNA2_91891_c0~~gnl/MRDRNA2_/MRDRNA2_91891_c0_seq1.p1  ORF type:complete len:947 (+),score=115.54 gnl/MRDRNA2_/MRDRNA2_91891_c0_seq1:60-2843(+)